MKVKIENLYLYKVKKEKCELEGSLHISLKIGKNTINIRSVMVKLQNERWFVHLPHSTIFCTKEKKLISFPIISIDDRDEHRKIYAEIHKQLPKFFDSYREKNPLFEKEIILHRDYLRKKNKILDKN